MTPHLEETDEFRLGTIAVDSKIHTYQEPSVLGSASIAPLSSAFRNAK